MACCIKGATSSRSALLLASAFLLLLLPPSARAATTYEVSASGGLDLFEAMSAAEAGDTVLLADGTYDQAVVSVRDGKPGQPITVAGGPGAIINGDYSGRRVLVTHSFITLKGFSIEGKKADSPETEESYINKCVYVEGTGTDSSSPLDGFVMEGMTVQNCGGECVRLKNFVINAIITGNTISNCGVYDYKFDIESGEKNGEGVYIGTSSNQWTYGEDMSNGNLITGNSISTSGNECVDIKEGASGNIVEHNSCYNQLDVESGCYDSRGDGNTFRYNVGTDCFGAGIRLGGWEVDGHQFGVGNIVYGNDFTAVGNGAINVAVGGQGDVCGNTCDDGVCSLRGDAVSDIINTWDQDCGDIGSSSTGGVPIPSTVTSSTDPTSSPAPPGSSSATPPPGGDGSASSSVDGSGEAIPLSEEDPEDGSEEAVPLSDGDDVVSPIVDDDTGDGDKAEEDKIVDSEDSDVDSSKEEDKIVDSENSDVDSSKEEDNIVDSKDSDVDSSKEEDKIVDSEDSDDDSSEDDEEMDQVYSGDYVYGNDNGSDGDLSFSDSDAGTHDDQRSDLHHRRLRGWLQFS